MFDQASVAAAPVDGEGYIQLSAVLTDLHEGQYVVSERNVQRYRLSSSAPVVTVPGTGIISNGTATLTLNSVTPLYEVIFKNDKFNQQDESDNSLAINQIRT